MKLKHLRITNCNRVSDIDIEIRGNLVLIGPNGSGKSTVLHCLDMLLGMDNLQLLRILTEKYIRDESQPMTVETVFGDLENDELTTFSDADDVQNGNDLRVRLDARFDDGSISITRSFSGNATPKKLSKTQIEAFGWTLLRAESNVRDIWFEQESIAEEEKRKINLGDGKAALGINLGDGEAALGIDLGDGKAALGIDLGDGKAALGNDLGAEAAPGTNPGGAETTSATSLIPNEEAFSKTAKHVSSMLPNAEALETMGQELARKLSQTLPFVFGKDDPKLPPEATGSNDLANSVQQKIRDDGLLQLVNEQSDGMRAFFTMVLYDLLRKGTNILAIDEPEAHLHPSSQRSLAKMLKAGDGQKILVTHSPTIAGSFEPEEIVVIRSDGSAVQPKEGFLRGDSGMFARWWIGRQLEPLTAGAVIAVEGPSDRIIVDRVATVLGFDLDRNDVVLVETNGCGDMKVVEAIFGDGGFGIPLYELIDKDAQDDVARRLKVNPSGLEARNIFVSVKDLEDEYVQAIGARKLWDRLKETSTFSKNVFALCKVEADGYPTEADLAEFIRGKSNRKIPSALVAAGLIDSTNALSMGSVTRLLKAASS